MFIKDITLHGFKSFAEKTRISFNPGVTIIVGPNGSGKSNIVDSIAWVLGEQSPKSLRSISMEDVIFLGGSTQPHFNVATVRLVLNNEDNTLPIDFQEVSIQRQTSKDENNLYLLNDVPCRLIDIKDLIASAGLGKQFKSIINQGELDNVITSHSKERKHLIKDACGVTKYEIRKKKAFRRLKKTDVNIFRLKDILSEVNRQLKPLKRQAEDAKRFSELENQIKEKEISLIVTALLNLKNNEKEINEKKEKIKTEIEYLKTDLGQLTSFENEIAEKVKNFSSKVQNDFDNLYELEKNAVTIKGWKSLVSEKNKHFKSMIRSWQDLESVLIKSREIDESDINALKVKLESLRKKIKKNRENLKEKNAILKKIREEISKKDIIFYKQKDKLQSLLLKLSIKNTTDLSLISESFNLLKNDVNKIILKMNKIKSILSKTQILPDQKGIIIYDFSSKKEIFKDILNFTESKLLNIKSGLQNSYEIFKKYESILKSLENLFLIIKNYPLQIKNLTKNEKNLLNELKTIEISLSVLNERKNNLEVKLDSIIEKGNYLTYGDKYRKEALKEAKNIRKRTDYLENIFKKMQKIAMNIGGMIRKLNEKDRNELENFKIEQKKISEKINYKREKIEELKEGYQILNLNNAQLNVNIQSKIDELRKLGYHSIDKAIKNIPKVSNIEKTENDIKYLKSELYEIGPINPIALEDYQKLDDRREFLSDQIKDLRNARKDLQQLISQTEDQMKNLFLESFEKVDMHFRALFKTLFPKGDAYLELINIGNEGEFGVDIKVNIGGIKNRAISLLSGGEKALISIAFIFALFNLMPSPFYILDEVDVTLDDINLQRFINLVEKYRKKHQLIIITHQRRTMEMADVLYGVSMNPDGISKVVSERI